MMVTDLLRWRAGYMDTVNLSEKGSLWRNTSGPGKG